MVKQEMARTWGAFPRLCPQEALNQARLLQCTGTEDCELLPGKSLSSAMIRYVAVDQEHMGARGGGSVAPEPSLPEGP